MRNHVAQFSCVHPKLMAAISSIEICTVCSNQLKKPQDRNLIEGKTRIIEDLKTLPFEVHVISEYICRSCLALVKKRKTLKEQLVNTEKTLKALAVSVGEFDKTVLVGTEDGFLASSTPRKARDVLVQDRGGDVAGAIEFRPTSLPSLRPTETATSSTTGPSRETSTPTATKVNIVVEWPSKKKNRSLEGDLAALGKMLCRGTLSQIARSVWRCKSIRKELLKEIAGEVNKESIKMCKKTQPSCLRKTGPDEIAAFSFENLNKELDENAPVTKMILMAVSVCKEKKGDDKNWVNAICVAVSVLLRNRKLVCWFRTFMMQFLKVMGKELSAAGNSFYHIYATTEKEVQSMHWKHFS